MLKTLIILIAAIVPFIAMAQTSTLLEEGIEKQVTLSYSNLPGETINQQMLGLVAKAKSLPVEQTQLVYTIKEHRKIIKNNQNLQLTIAVGNFVHPETISYLNFPINSYLVPTLVNFTYNWENSEKQLLETKKTTSSKFKNGTNLFKNTLPDSYQDSTYYLYLTELAFGFEMSDVKKLDEFMNTVDAYYNADARLNLMEQELLQIKSDSIELLENNFQLTLDNQKLINQYKFMRFPSKLDLDANDPVKFVSHLGRAEEQNKTVKKELEFARDNMHITYYKKGLDWLKWGNPQKATELFKKSIEIKPAYAPPYIELAQFNFNQKNYSPAIDSCKKVLISLKPDTETRFKAVKLSESVIFAYIDSVKQFIEFQHYPEAVALFERSKMYAKEIPGIKIFSEFEIINRELLEAFYKQHLEKTEYLIQNNQLIAALVQIDSLIDFRQRNSQYVQLSLMEERLLKTLYNQWLFTGKKAMELQEFDSCSFALNQASYICTTYKSVPCDAALDKLILQANQALYASIIEGAARAIQEQLADSALNLLKKADAMVTKFNLQKNPKTESLYLQAKQVKYSDLIKTGDLAFRQNQMREALAFYQEAKVIETELPVTKNMELDGKTTQSAKNLVLILCNQSETYLEALNMELAQQKYTQATQIANQYQLNQEPEVVHALESLTGKLNQGKCSQVIHEFTIQLIATKKLVEKKEYIFANQSIEKASALIASNPGCHIDPTELTQIKQLIKPIATYQYGLLKINEHIDAKEYKQAIDEYLYFSDFFEDSCPEKYSLIHKPFDEYLKTHANSMFIDYGVTYYSNNDQTGSALELLKILKQRNYNSGWSKVSQENLGKKLAQLDLEQNRDQDPKTKVLDYTHSDKWYNPLKKAYLEEWKLKKF